MVWSVDQDDTKYSAMEGLTGQSIQNPEDQLKKSQVTDTGHWASLNGQKCKLTDYTKGDKLKCEPGWASPPNGGKIKDNCGKAGDRMVRCPVDSMPSTCVSKMLSIFEPTDNWQRWRGGETPPHTRCHGQCHAGEMTLFHSRHAARSCLRLGFQAFCCEATSFKALIDACNWTECKYPRTGKPNQHREKTRCGADTVKVASKFAAFGDNASLGDKASVDHWQSVSSGVRFLQRRHVHRPMLSQGIRL